MQLVGANLEKRFKLNSVGFRMNYTEREFSRFSGILVIKDPRTPDASRVEELRSFEFTATRERKPITFDMGGRERLGNQEIIHVQFEFDGSNSESPLFDVHLNGALMYSKLLGGLSLDQQEFVRMLGGISVELSKNDHNVTHEARYVHGYGMDFKTVRLPFESCTFRHVTRW